jgi:hypothetical protein
VTVTVPLLVLFGMNGLALGMAIMTVASLCVRTYFLRRLFPAYSMVRQGVRGVIPTLPAVAVVFAMRAAEPGSRTVEHAVAEFCAFVLLTVATTLVSERTLLREVLGYLRGRRVRPSLQDASAAGTAA